MKIAPDLEDEAIPPLADALARAGKDSLGMVAEALIKLLGSRGKEPGSWATGRAAGCRVCVLGS